MLCFMCFSGYTKKLHMWFRVFCFFNILWIFIENKNYVVESAENQSSPSCERSHKRLRLENQSVLYSNISKFGSCEPSVENVSGNFTVTDIVPVPDDAPSTSSDKRYLRSANLKETFNEPQRQPSLPCLADILDRAEDMQALSDSDKSDDETDELLNEIMTMINPQLPKIDNEAMMKRPESGSAFTDSDTPDAETVEESLDEILRLLSPSSQTMNNETMMNIVEGESASRDSDTPDAETIEEWLDEILKLLSPKPQTIDNKAMIKSPEGCEGWDEISDSDNSDDEVDKRLLGEIMKSLNPKPQTMDNKAMIKSPENCEGWDELKDSDKSDDEVDKRLLDDILKSIGSDSQTMDTASPVRQPEYSDNEQNLNTLIEDGEQVLLGSILSPLKTWDTSTLHKNVNDALNILPDEKSDSNNTSENIFCDQVECSMEEMPSVSGIQLKDVRLQHDTNVKNVTTGNEESSDVLKKEAKKITKRNPNDSDKEAATSSQAFSNDGLITGIQSLDLELMKSMTEKLTQHCELHKYFPMHEINAPIKEIEETISCESERKIAIENTNIGKSSILRLFLSILSSKIELNCSNDFKSVSEIFNSSVIFKACLVCLLIGYHKYLFHVLGNCKKILSKKSTVLKVMENFLKIDEPGSSVRLHGLLNFFTADKFTCIYHLYKSIITSVFCLLEEKDSFFKMHQKLKECHERLKSLYSVSDEVAKICKNKEKGVDAKAKDLKERLVSYVDKINSFLRELQEEQNNLITNVSNRFSNVKQMMTFICCHVGTFLIVLCIWNIDQRTVFLFLITVLNQLLIACEPHVNRESNIKEEISSLLTEKEYLLEAIFGNMFLLIYKALTLQLKVHVEKTLKEINEETHIKRNKKTNKKTNKETNKETNISGKLTDNEILKSIANLCSEVKQLKHYVFSVLVEIEDKKKELEEQEHISSKLRKIDDDVRTLMDKINFRSGAIRKKKLKEEASEFEKIIKQFSLVFDEVGKEPLEEEKLKQLKDYVKSLQGTNSSSDSE